MDSIMTLTELMTKRSNNTATSHTPVKTIKYHSNVGLQMLILYLTRWMSLKPESVCSIQIL